MSPNQATQFAFPEEIAKSLPTNTSVKIRPLNVSDINNGYFELLGILTAAPKPSQEQWEKQFQTIANDPAYYPIVVTDTTDDSTLLGAGTLLVEQKFIRNCGTVGHIEDIVVAENTQGKGIGKLIITALTKLSEQLGSYKTILDCDEKNVPFYIKTSYERKGVQMAKYK